MRSHKFTIELLKAIGDTQTYVFANQLEKMLPNVKYTNITSTLRNCFLRDELSRVKDVRYKYKLTAKGHCVAYNETSIKQANIDIATIRYFFKNTKPRVGEIYC